MNFARSLKIDKAGINYLQWPIASYNELLDYYLDVNSAVYVNGDFISSVRVNVAPSGSGEIEALDVDVVDGVIRIDLQGGVPGRLYRVRVNVNTFLGRDYSWIVNLPIRKEYVPGPYQVAPDPGFGPDSNWAMIALENGQGFWRLENDLGNWVWG
jgi:hypothetical protein